MALKEPKRWYEATFEDFGCKTPVIKKWSAMGTIEEVVFGAPMLWEIASGLKPRPLGRNFSFQKPHDQIPNIYVRD